MSNALAAVNAPPQPAQLTHRRTVEELLGQRARVIEVMRGAMKDGIHFGKIPGTPKPTLYKPGADMLLSMFRWGSKPVLIEDLSTYDEVRYRVHCAIYDVATEIVLEVGIGECSSSEQKYRWRQPVCRQEFDETPEDRKRSVWKRKGSEFYQQQQVRTEPADIANTVLKMAKKRAKVDGVIGATACGDVFGQDIEDLPEGWSEFTDDDAQTIAVEGQQVVDNIKPAQQAAPAAAAEASEPSSDAVKVASVRIVKTGTNSRGEWKLYAVKFSNKAEFTTLDGAVAEEAKRLQASGAAVEYRTEEHDGKTNLAAIRGRS